MRKHTRNQEDIPLGMGLALSRNTDALRAFARLDYVAQQAFLDGSRGLRSRQAVEDYVSNLIDRG